MTSPIVTLSSLKKPRFYLPLVPAFSAWLGHAPFAFWLVENHKPRLIVELGAHYGFSFLCFCQQVADMRLQAECYAIDTWAGDEHAGFYGEEIFKNLNLFHNANYGSFSRLVRSKFNDAVHMFPDGSIDLLHIDGRHFYQDVKEDFETWLPKLSDRAVVLFHDTQVRQGNFGVYRLWNEVRQSYPHFEFLHAYGLGVLWVGSKRDDNCVSRYFTQLDVSNTSSIQVIYEFLGSLIGENKKV